MKLFVSYAHEDRKWLELVITHLKTLPNADITFWSDLEIRMGDKWEEEINHALHNADCAILLLSADFLVSEFIQKKELPLLYQRHLENQMRLIPILVRECHFENHPIIGPLEIHPKGLLPLAREDGKYLDADLTKIVKELQTLFAPATNLASSSTDANSSDDSTKATTKPIQKKNRKGCMLQIAITFVAIFAVTLPLVQDYLRNQSPNSGPPNEMSSTSPPTSTSLPVPTSTLQPPSTTLPVSISTLQPTSTNLSVSTSTLRQNTSTTIQRVPPTTIPTPPANHDSVTAGPQEQPSANQKKVEVSDSIKIVLLSNDHDILQKVRQLLSAELEDQENFILQSGIINESRVEPAEIKNEYGSVDYAYSIFVDTYYEQAGNALTGNELINYDLILKIKIRSIKNDKVIFNDMLVGEGIGYNERSAKRLSFDEIKDDVIKIFNTHAKGVR